MAITQAMCTSFKAEILDEQHDLVADTLKIALYTSSASLGAGTTAFTTSNEITGTGYSSGGVETSILEGLNMQGSPFKNGEEETGKRETDR